MISKGLIAVVLALAIPVCIVSGVVAAQSFHAQDTVTVTKGETVDGAVYTAGKTVTVSGTVNGDVYCAGQTVVIEGTVNGDVVCAAQTIKLAGTVTGDVRLAAQIITIDGKVGGSASVLAQTAAVGRGTVVGGDFNGAAETVTLSGVITRDVALATNFLTVSGNVGRNIDSRAENLLVANGAAVGGRLSYSSSKPATIAEGTVSGEIKYNEVKREVNQEQNDDGFGWGLFFYYIGSLLLVSLVAVLLFPRLIHATAKHGFERPGITAVVGAAGLILAPVVIILTLITVIGIPLAMVLTLLWWVILVAGAPVFSYYVGQLVLRGRTTNAIYRMAVGAIIVLILYSIPLINFLVFIVASIFGVGMVLMAIASHWRRPKYDVSSKKA